MPLISSRLPRPPKRSSPGLPLDQWCDDAGQDFDGPVQLDGHFGVFAQSLVVPWGGRQIHNGHCSAVDGHGHSYVLNDPGGHEVGESLAAVCHLRPRLSAASLANHRVTITSWCQAVFRSSAVARSPDQSSSSYNSSNVRWTRTSLNSSSRLCSIGFNACAQWPEGGPHGPQA